jgi:hypothetical protein
MAVAILLSPLALALADHNGVRNEDLTHNTRDAEECSDSEGLCYSLESPLKSNIITIEGLLTTILNVLLVIAVPIIVFFIIFAGFTYVTAQGNPEKIKTATRSLTYAIIGAVLILGGVAISEIIASVVSSFQT